MKKLLALLLLSPLGLTEESLTVEPTNTLDLERLSQFFPNDSYMGFTCRTKDSSYDSSATMRMFVLSLEEKKGINLIDATFIWLKFSEQPYPEYINLMKNEKWGQLTVTDWYITIENPGRNKIDRNELTVRYDTPCEISTQDEMKQFGYKILKQIQVFEKRKKDDLESKLKKRKL
jgi:hypothetical protein